MYTLENNRFRFRLDDAGKVVSLANAETGREEKILMLLESDKGILTI